MDIELRIDTDILQRSRYSGDLSDSFFEFFCLLWWESTNL